MQYDVYPPPHHMKVMNFCLLTPSKFPEQHVSEGRHLTNSCCINETQQSKHLSTSLSSVSSLFSGGPIANSASPNPWGPKPSSNVSTANVSLATNTDWTPSEFYTCTFCTSLLPPNTFKSAIRCFYICFNSFTKC